MTSMMTIFGLLGQKAMTEKNYKIAVFGSAKEDLDKRIYALAEEVGKLIAKSGYTLVTGAATGISRYASIGAKRNGGYVIGISPTTNIDEIDRYKVSFDNIDYLIHTGAVYKGRNVISVRTCDGMIILNGGFGTLNEVTIGEGEQKPIVAISDTGGCADILETIFKHVNPTYKLFAVVRSAKEALAEIRNLIESSKRIGK